MDPIGIRNDAHLRPQYLARLAQCIAWSENLFRERGCKAVLDLGDVTDKDVIGSRLATPGEVIGAYTDALDPFLFHHVLNGNHDQEAAGRGSSLRVFETSRTIQPYFNLDLIDLPQAVFVAIPWQYPQKWVSPQEFDELKTQPGAAHALFTSRVSARLQELYAKARETAKGRLVGVAAHAQVRGSMFSATMPVHDTSFELLKDDLRLFNFGILGDIHLRQEILPNVWYTGALSQGGSDEAGNYAGATILHFEKGKVRFEFVECPHAIRYSEHEISGDTDDAPGEFSTYRYKCDGTEQSERTAIALVRKYGIQVKIDRPATAVKARTDHQLEGRNPPDVVKFYAKVKDIPAEKRDRYLRRLETV